MVNNIRPFQEKDTQQVIELWQVCNLIRPWNNPEQDIIRKQQVSDQLFLVLECNDRIIGTVMGGYDGHRGFMNYLAINPKFRGNGYGSMLVTTIEDKLKALGCPKVHLLIRSDNAQVSDFYTNLDYENQATGNGIPIIFVLYHGALREGLLRMLIEDVLKTNSRITYGFA